MFLLRTVPKEHSTNLERICVSRRHLAQSGTLFPILISTLALLPLVARPAFAGGDPGGEQQQQFALAVAPGATYPWEGSSSDTNTGNGNKLTTVPLLRWDALGAVDVAFNLYHNSQGDGISELGNRWTHSYDLYLLLSPYDATASIKWGDALGIAFAYNPYTGDYINAAGIHDTLTYTTGSGGAFTSFTLTTKAGVKYLYTNPVGNRWSCASITDRNGNVTTIAHNTLGYVTSVTDPSGRVLTFNYNSSNQLTSVSDPASRTFSFSFNSSGNLSSVTYPDPDGAGSLTSPVVSFSYDSSARITTLTDPRGNASTFSYNSNGSIAWEKDALLHQTSYSYTSSYTNITDARGNTIRHNYSSGCLSSVRNALMQTTSCTYDSDNNRTSVTDAAGKIWSCTYDSNGNTLTMTDPLSHTTTLTYNSLNKPLTVTSPLGRVTTNTYDGNGNLLTVTTPLSSTTTATTTFTYLSSGLIDTITDPLGHVTDYGYDSAGNRTSLLDATGRTLSYGYDTLGKRTSVTSGGLTASYSYDNLGRLTSITAPGSRVVSFGYDANSNQTSITNNLSEIDTYVYDAANRVTSHTDALSRTVSFGYDNNNNKTSLTDGRGKITTYVYDVENRNTGISYPDSTSESWAYNSRGSIATYTDGRGIVTTNTFDDAKRLTGLSYSSGASSVSFSYNNDDRKTGMVDGTGTTSYTYDLAGRLIGRTSPQGSVAYGYDAANRKVSEAVNSIFTPTTFGYDNADRLTSVVAPSGTTYYSYDSAGRLVTTALPNGVSEDRTYSSSTGDLTEVWHSKSTGTVTIAKFSYTFDGLGRKLTESQPSGVGIAYTYDAVGQLTDEVRTGGSLFTANYTYDNAGNRLTKTVGGVTENYTYDNANKLTAAGGKTYSYDAAGNVTSVTSGGVTTTLTWDGAGRLTSIAGGSLSTTNTATYNGISQRVTKVDSNGSAGLVLGGDRIDSCILSDGAASYQHGLGLISETRSTTTKFFHLDSLGTTRALTDASGSKTDGLETDAFGMVVSTSGTPLGSRPFGFAADHGYQSDSDTGLQQLGYRFYDASIGRFLSRDPIREGYNWYIYCDNNPVNNVDPQGLGVQKFFREILDGIRRFFTRKKIKDAEKTVLKSIDRPNLERTVDEQWKAEESGTKLLDNENKGVNRVENGNNLQRDYQAEKDRQGVNQHDAEHLWGLENGFGHVLEEFGKMVDPTPISDMVDAIKWGVKNFFNPWLDKQQNRNHKRYGDLLD